MKKDLQFFAVQWKAMSKRGRVVFSIHLLISFIVLVFYIFIYGYPFWNSDSPSGLVAISACMIFLYIMYLQFNPFARVWTWLLMPGYGFSMFTFSHFEGFDMNVIYVALILMVVMMTLSAWLNRFLKNDSNTLSDR